MKSKKRPINVKKILKILIFSIIIIIGIELCLSSCSHGDISGVKEKYSDSELYTAEEIKEAFIMTKKQFKDDFGGCKLTDIWYDDSVNQIETKKWKKEYNAEKAIVILSTFSAGPSPAEGLTPGEVYSKWKWVFVKEKGSNKWIFKTCGY